MIGRRRSVNEWPREIHHHVLYFVAARNTSSVDTHRLPERVETHVDLLLQAVAVGETVPVFSQDARAVCFVQENSCIVFICQRMNATQWTFVSIHRIDRLGYDPL